MNWTSGEGNWTSVNGTEAWSATRVQFLLYGLLMPLICIPGMLANLASLIVFTRPKMRNSINTYLAGLSVFDFFLLLMSLFLYPPLAYAQEFSSSFFYSIFNYTVFAAFPISLVVQFCSVYTCVAIAMDRFMAVRYPIHVRNLSTPRRATAALVGIFAVAVIFRFPAVFEIQLDANFTLRQTPLRMDPMYQLVYTTILYTIVIYFIPFLTMTVLNCFLAKSLHKAYVTRSGLAQRTACPSSRLDSERERKWNMTAILIICSFLVLNAPAFVSHVLEGTLPKATMSSTPVRTFVFMSNILVCINSAINFVIYCIVGIKFRQMFIKIFFPCLDKRNPYTLSSASGTFGTAAQLLNVQGYQPTTHTHSPQSRGVLVSRS